jgi:endonuclease-3
MHELISTMLSHRTTQQDEALAFDRMWDRFGSWEGIRDAPVEALIEAIAPANFAEAKAPRIQEALDRIISERGEPSIDFLRDLPAAEGLAWLMALPGVGIKTASLVLLFCFSKPLLPVDTHVHRVSQRVGLIGPKASAEAAHKLLLDMLPNDPPLLFNFHVAMLKHGQRVCVWQTPRCDRCPLRDLCNWYAEHRKKA